MSSVPSGHPLRFFFGARGFFCGKLLTWRIRQAGSKRQFGVVLGDLSVPVGLFVGFGDWAEDFAGVSDGYGIIWDVFDDDAAASDYYVVSDCYAGHDLDAGADPYVVSYSDWIGVF